MALSPSLDEKLAQRLLRSEAGGTKALESTKPAVPPLALHAMQNRSAEGVTAKNGSDSTQPPAPLGGMAAAANGGSGALPNGGVANLTKDAVTPKAPASSSQPAPATKEMGAPAAAMPSKEKAQNSTSKGGLRVWQHLSRMLPPLLVLAVSLLASAQLPGQKVDVTLHFTVESNAVALVAVLVVLALGLRLERRDASTTGSQAALAKDARAESKGQVRDPAAPANLALKLQAMPKEVKELLWSEVAGQRNGECLACHTWEGDVDEHVLSLSECTSAQTLLACRAHEMLTSLVGSCKPVTPTEKLFWAMMATSPALVYRIEPEDLASSDPTSSPVFTACRLLWSVRTGIAPTEDPPKRYFCITPHGHSERLCCSFIFARPPGQGFRERRLYDWPSHYAGQPWGPNMSADELQSYRQPDESVLLMVHAVDLICDGDANPPFTARSARSAAIA